MPDSPTPGVGLVALAAMFLLPLLEQFLHPGRARAARSFVASYAGFSRPFMAPGLQSPQEAPERFRGLVRVQRIRWNPTDWCRGVAWALMCEVPGRAGGATRALADIRGEAS
jgi:hypothetical protein